MNAVRWFPRGCGRRPRRSGVAQAVLALLVLCTAAMAGAAIEDPAGPQTTPPRLGFVEGDVLFWRPGAGDWEAAQVNLPLADGDALATRDGKLELQIGGKSFIRAGDGTQMRLKSNEPGFLQLEVTSGHVAVDVRELPHAGTIEVDTANGSIRVARDGYYRIDVDSQATRVTVRRGGQAAVTPVGGSVADVATGEAVEMAGTTDARLSALAASPFDDWDRWNYDRADHFLATPRAYAVSSDIYGVEELDQNGDWRYVNTYGRVWVPSSVPAGWAPYTYGRWVSDPVYGYSWVDYSPWGWAPYHYGRWVYPGYWAWAPGPVVVAPVYSPALVAFYGGPGFAVGFGFPFVSWVALGWGQPLYPWWGPVGFIGTPCWWGWGGPHWGNNWNNHWNNNWGNHGGNNWGNHGGGNWSHNGGGSHPPGNAGVPGAMVSVPRDQFASRSINSVRLSRVSANQLKPIQGALPVVARGVPAGAAGKMPVPNLPSTQRSPAAMSEAKAGAVHGAQQLGVQRSGAGTFGSGSKAPGSTALDAVHRAGPGALTAPSRMDFSRSAAPAVRATGLSRGQTPPPLPNGLRAGASRSAFVPQSARGASASASPAGSFGRVQTQPPPVPRRMASVDRGSASWGRPAATTGMRSSPAPGRAPAPSMASQGVSRGPSGGFSAGASRSGWGGIGHSFGGMHGGGGRR